jgi:hypothetical protein
MGFEPMHTGQGYVAILAQESVRNILDAVVVMA